MKFGFRSKSVLDRRGFFAGKFQILSITGITKIIEGRSQERNVKDNYKVMVEDARLHAVSQFLYNNGFQVEKSNYESLDIDKIESVKLLNYAFYYTENEFQSYSNIKREYKSGTRRYIAQRNKKGRFVKWYSNNSVEKSKEIRDEIDLRYQKKDFARKFA